MSEDYNSSIKEINKLEENGLSFLEYSNQTNPIEHPLQNVNIRRNNNRI